MTETEAEEIAKQLANSIAPYSFKEASRMVDQILKDVDKQNQ
jgi:hypothetical protein